MYYVYGWFVEWEGWCFLDYAICAREFLLKENEKKSVKCV